MSTDFFATGVQTVTAPDFEKNMELKFQEFLAEINEPCKLAEFFNVNPLLPDFKF